METRSARTRRMRQPESPRSRSRCTTETLAPNAPRLDEVDAADYRVAQLAVRMSHHDHIRTAGQVRQRRCRVFVTDARRIGGGAATEPRVDQRDRHVGVAVHGLERRRGRSRNGRDAHPAAELVTVPDHRPGRRESRDGDADALAPKHAVRGKEQRVAGDAEHVRADVGKPRVGDGPSKKGEPPVEVVAPRRGGVVAGEVQRFHDGMRGRGRDPGEVGGERIALQEVARVYHQHLPRILRPERVHHRRDAGDPAGERAVRHVVPVGGAAVHIGRGHEHDVRRILKRCSGEDERGEEGEHRQAIWRREGHAVILSGAKDDRMTG